MSNFDMFQKQWPIFAKLGGRAEVNVYSDPNISMIKIRQFAEQMTEAIFSLERLTPWNLETQVDKLRELERVGVLDSDISAIFHKIRIVGNKAVHDGYDDEREAMNMLRLSHYLSNWFMEVYGDLNFKTTEFIEPKDIDKFNAEEIAKLKAQIELAESEKQEFQAQLEKIARSQKDESEASFNKLKSDRRQRSRKFLRNNDLTEKQTRIMFIDEQLRDAGWEADTKELDWCNGARPEKGKNKAIAEFPTKNGHRADYALFIGLKLVGIIEAKKYNQSVAGDIVQSKEYAKEVASALEYTFDEVNDGYKVPFIYATNGRPYLKQLAEQSGVWFWDARTPQKASYALESWHSPQDLLQKLVVDEKKAEKELGRVLIILNSTVDMEKSQMLANLYKAYINEKINWNQFCEFSEIIKMLFLNDFNIIKLIYNHQVTDTSGIEIYPIDRLSSLGIVNTAMKSIMISNSANSRSDKYVNLTSIGEKFYESVINS